MSNRGGCLSQILGIIKFWSEISFQYERIKSDPERREKSVFLGVRSIIQTIICAALAAASLYGGIYLLAHFSGAVYGPITLVFWIAGIALLFAAAVVSVLTGIVGGLLCMIYQFRLNKRAVRWIALAVWIVAVLGAIAVVIALLAIIE